MLILQPTFQLNSLISFSAFFFFWQIHRIFTQAILLSINSCTSSLRYYLLSFFLTLFKLAICLLKLSHRSPKSWVFSISSLRLILPSFYNYVFKFTICSSAMTDLPLFPSSVFYISDIVVSIYRSFIWIFLKIKNCLI